LNALWQGINYVHIAFPFPLIVVRKVGFPALVRLTFSKVLTFCETLPVNIRKWGQEARILTEQIKYFSEQVVKMSFIKIKYANSI